MIGYNEKVLNEVLKLKPVLWINPLKKSFSHVSDSLEFNMDDILDADYRLRRFSPLIKRLFPETGTGIIESDLSEVPSLKNGLEEAYDVKIGGRMFVKCDSHLKIAGSVKARGGIYEVLKHAEYLALQEGLLSIEDDYSKMENGEFKEFFSRYSISVGSTGNLGLSIGIMGRALGFSVTVHMSSDARQWKKDLLTSKGVQVIEHKEDYSFAVECGRRQCQGDPNAYFVDDENSRDLFLGYSVAALRLKKQLDEKGVNVDCCSPLYVYLPCGVGGAPGGIVFGLKSIFGDNARCYFVEPVHSPCMLLGLLTGKYNKVHVRDYGIDNKTEADGLAVGSPSGLVSGIAEKLIDGIYTIGEDDMLKLLVMLKDTEGIKLEPSAAAGLLGPALVETPQDANHISWATGGLLLPDDIYYDMYYKGKKLLHA